ncbi:MAG: hypothetical protein H7288_21365 [Kineosporiaceae bacterium]|nr:hypothetical protein [Aeromicrobium sp.]
MSPPPLVLPPSALITHRTYLHYMKTDSDLSGIARIKAKAAAKKLEIGVEK